ncbi:MAG TPA: STAS domain-containing protein [Planctomycetaceae bacterium]|nr:STAS domain-containing protein [Planctomycetaceae bacterium]
MPATEKLRDHRVLEVDLFGDTLVVIPAGDAVGFGLNVVNNEVAKVLEVAKSSRVKHLVIDLGRANYFGSVMIGEFMRLGVAVRERGGRIALCGASADMQDVLRIMKLDSMWEIFPRQDDAVRAIARVPFREHLWRKRRWFAAAGLIAAGIALYILIPRPQYDRMYYPEVKKIWMEIGELQRRQASDTEWEIFISKSQEKLAPIVARLERYASADRVAARFLLYVARDSIPAAMAERNRPKTHVDSLMGDRYIESIESLHSGGLDTVGDYSFLAEIKPAAAIDAAKPERPDAIEAEPDSQPQSAPATESVRAGEAPSPSASATDRPSRNSARISKD